jgi:hypothetical protein
MSNRAGTETWRQLHGTVKAGHVRVTRSTWASVSQSLHIAVPLALIEDQLGNSGCCTNKRKDLEG